MRWLEDVWRMVLREDVSMLLQGSFCSSVIMSAVGTRWKKVSK